MDIYSFVKKSIQSEDGVKDLISDKYIGFALEIIEKENLIVSDSVLEYLKGEAAKIEHQ